MVRSMTGYGRCEQETSDLRVTVEIKAVNHRYLDFFIRLPKSYGALEEILRHQVKRCVARGRIEINVTLEELGEKERMMKIDWGLLRGFLKELASFEPELHSLAPLSVGDLLQIPDFVRVSEAQVDLDGVSQLLAAACENALAQLSAMRQQEGTSLAKDILHRLAKVEHLIQDIEVAAPQMVVNYRRLLGERLEALLEGTTLSEERFQAEVTLFADRCNIDEELVRLHTHRKHFEQTVTQAGSAGRKLDFLLQEMNREVNTIGSKANDSRIAYIVVELKSEIEKIREQVQNIE